MTLFPPSVTVAGHVVWENPLKKTKKRMKLNKNFFIIKKYH